MSDETPNQNRGRAGLLGSGALRALVLGLAGMVAAPASAAGRSVTDELVRVDAAVADVEARLGRLSREYGQRRGLIGAEEARQRYEDAVFLFLIGEYESSALTFFTLVESQALGETGLHQDAEWYLAEAVFELGNWATAIESYQRIIDFGTRHPFFNDAVRGQLEAYGLMGDSEGFYDVYRTWILSGRVPATDAVKYTVAKSFFRQGETGRAKAMFSEQPSGSSYYARSRYFLGTILATEGEHEQAIAEFDKVASPESGASEEVEQLARLALGRVHYEVGSYEKAVEYYQSIPSDSPWFADQLYELVWTYIKKEDWGSALQHVEIFLIAFPDHKYSLQMRLNQGHLNMKASSFERALASYESVVINYTPLQERLARLEASQADPGQFFEGIVRSDVERLQGDGRLQLPAYAVEMLVEDPSMARVVDASRELDGQGIDLRGARSTLDEISSVLGSSDEAIGTFGRGRQALLRVRDDALQLLYRLLEAELAYVAANNPQMTKQQERALTDELSVLATRAQQVQGLESARTDRYQAHEDQVRAVQEEAVKTNRLLASLRAEAAASRRVLAEKRRSMSVDEVDLVELELDRLEGLLNNAERELDVVSSNATLRQVMSSVPRGRASDTDVQRGLLLSDYVRLHDKLRGFRSGVTSDSTPLRDAEGLWTRVLALDGDATAVRSKLETAEQRELQLLQAGVRDQMGVVGALEADVGQTNRATAVLASDITRAGFGQLEDQLSTDIMAADMGIVDVYWLRKTEVVNERTELATERADRLQELNSRFDLIRQKLEE